MLWNPTPSWLDADAYLIGGGPSLRAFDWGLLRGRNTIGCNSAYRLGVDVCKVATFGDRKFYDAFQGELARFPGMVVTNLAGLRDIPWLQWMPRQPRGLSRDRLGWNGNTGALAINIALLLGARRVFLLGYDMGYTGDTSHWHDWRLDKPRMEVYDRFRAGFAAVAADLPRVFPGSEVWNVTNGSNLDVFPKVPVAFHFSTNTGGTA